MCVVELPRHAVDVIDVDPLHLCFTHDCILSCFSAERTSLDDTIDDLLSGALAPEVFPPLEVVKHQNGKLCSLSNRRLLIFSVMANWKTDCQRQMVKACMICACAQILDTNSLQSTAGSLENEICWKALQLLTRSAREPPKEHDLLDAAHAGDVSMCLQAGPASAGPVPGHDEN